MDIPSPSLEILDGTGLLKRDDAFNVNQALRLQQIKLPDTLIVIDKCVFGYCRNLQSIRLPKRLAAIGDFAFSESGLQKITLPASLRELSRTAFYSCSSLKKITWYANQCEEVGTKQVEIYKPLLAPLLQPGESCPNLQSVEIKRVNSSI